MPIQTFHMVASPEMRGATCFILQLVFCGAELVGKECVRQVHAAEEQNYSGRRANQDSRDHRSTQWSLLRIAVAQNLTGIIAAGSHKSVRVDHFHSVNRRRQRAEHSPLG
jgi:hypothetical protein